MKTWTYSKHSKTMFTIKELKDVIDSIPEEDLDKPVYLLMQPNWPFDYSISQADFIPEERWEREGYDQNEKRPGLYLTEGSQLCYAGSVELSYFDWR